MSDAAEGVHATVDHDVCVGASLCLQQAPGAFVLDQGGQSVFLPAGSWTAEDLERAADACPMSAIEVTGREPE